MISFAKFLLHHFRTSVCKKVSELSDKRFSYFVKNSIWMSRGTICRTIIFWDDWIFPTVSYCEQNNSRLLVKIPCKIVKNACSVYKLNFWGILLKMFYLFTSFSEYEQKSIKLLGQKTRQASLNCHLEVRRKILRKKNFFEKKLYVPLHRFWTSGQIFSELWRQYFSTFVQTAFYLSIWGVWEKLFIW